MFDLMKSVTKYGPIDGAAEYFRHWADFWQDKSEQFKGHATDMRTAIESKDPDKQYTVDKFAKDSLKWMDLSFDLWDEVFQSAQSRVEVPRCQQLAWVLSSDKDAGKQKQTLVCDESVKHFVWDSSNKDYSAQLEVKGDDDEVKVLILKRELEDGSTLPRGIYKGIIFADRMPPETVALLTVFVE